MSGFAGIIAAGEGSRLKDSHPGVVKPLVPVAGEPLSHWIARSLEKSGVDNVTLLHNSRGRALRAELKGAFPKISWTFLEADTASSWESFRLVSRAVSARAMKFVMTTIDTLAAPADLSKFQREAGDAAAVAVTAHVDDEKPLWADIENGFVIAFGDKAVRRRWCTSGIYQMTRPLADAMPPAAAYTKLRDYWGALLAARTPVRAVALGKTLDVDRPEDIVSAEEYVRSTPW